MRKRWTNRKLFTLRFKGREPRALLWRKPDYKEWFLYAKLAQELGKKIPKAFGNLKKFDDFEDWWRHPKYGFELFCEKPMGELVQETQPNRSKLQPDELLLKINLKGDLEIINRDIKRLLISKDVGEDYTSNARFQPSRSMKHISVGVTDKEYEKGVKRDNKLKRARETYIMSLTMSPKEIVKELKLMPQMGGNHWSLREDTRQMTKEDFLKTYGGDPKQYQFALDNRIKTVRRQIRNVEKSFENIAIGTFP